MTVNPELFIHESDRAALNALKAIPGFTPLLKAFMKVWDEQRDKITNMSTNLRISEKQLPHYYSMLLPICQKLGIDVPELYLELDVVPNAYTAGDTKPYIVITSGLLETMPEELIPTVLAHECGHIACHHCLYTVMGQMVLKETTVLGLSEFISVPLRMAFFYWMRSSEFSADRAAALCDGNSDNIAKMCMCFAGATKNIHGEFNADEFMKQAVEYKRMVSDSKWSKAMEFDMYGSATHPLNAVRAYDCYEWCQTEKFHNLLRYMTGKKGETDVVKLPVTFKEKQYLGMNYLDAMQSLQDIGFVDIELNRLLEQKGAKKGQVLDLKINGRDDFALGDWFDADTHVVITYYEPLSEDEVIALHRGEIRMPDSAKSYMGRNYRAVTAEMKGLGFTNIVVCEQKDLKKGWLNKAGSVSQISVAGRQQFDSDSWFMPDAEVVVTYHTFVD